MAVIEHVWIRGLNAMATIFDWSQSSWQAQDSRLHHPSAPPAAPPLAASTSGTTVSDSRCMERLATASGYAATPPSAPVTPAMPPGSNHDQCTDDSRYATGTEYGKVDLWVQRPWQSSQPGRLSWQLKTKQEQARRAAVSPTRHAPGSQLPGAYLNEFGLGCVSHGGFFHRRLPDVFLPKWIWRRSNSKRLPSFLGEEPQL